MLNQIVLVGRLANEIKIEGEKAVVTLAVPRPYKNADGEYDTDFIDCVLNGNIATNTVEYCSKGDVIGIKGRIQTFTNNDGKKSQEIVAEKVTFLSSKPKDK